MFRQLLLGSAAALSLAGAIVLASPQEAKASCGFLDITCSPDEWTCPIGGCNGGGGGTSDSSVGRDMTPPQVRTARNMMGLGYQCIEVNEFPAVTCGTPSGMASWEFQVRHESYWGWYLAPSKEWAWDCMNRGGQLWGSPSQLQCVSGMR